MYVDKRETVTYQDSNLAEIVRQLQALLTNEHAANLIKFPIILNVEDEKFFVQDNICVNNCYQFVYKENFATLKKGNLR